MSSINTNWNCPMANKHKKRGITFLEVLVVIVILLAVFMPYTTQRNSHYRHTRCKSNLSQIGRGILLFDEQKGMLPKSQRKPAAAPGTETQFDINSRGWSWAFQITPYMERRDLFELIDLSNPDDNPGQSADKVRAVAAADLPIFACPSYKGSRWVEYQASGPRPETLDESIPDRCMISNYKALAASTMESLAVAYGGPKPDYGTEHPDGVINPNTSYPIDAISDGNSNTILLAESAEQAYSRWIYGNEMEMIGLPSTIEMVEADGFQFKMPKGFDPKDPQWYEDSPIDPGKDGSGQPFAAWEYSGSEKEPSYCSKQTNNPDAWLGPSSDHPNIVNHLFADGSTTSISKTVDAAAYYFMSTRNGGDMAPPKR